MTERPNRIRYFRRVADLSQDELADRLGVHRQTVSDWERGVFRPELETAMRLARELGCSMDLLFMPAESVEVPDNSLDGPDSGPASAALPLDGQEPTSSSSGGPVGSPGFLAPRSHADPTADRSLPAKESSADLEGAR